MIGNASKVAVVQGMPGASVQKLFRILTNQWQPSIRIAGVLAEDHGLPDRFCSAGYFRNLTTRELFSVFEDLGPGSTDCHLEGTGALAAAAAVRKDIAAGCDLVILSKFGKMEAAGKGLVGAFEAGDRRGRTAPDVCLSRARGGAGEALCRYRLLLCPAMQRRSAAGGKSFNPAETGMSGTLWPHQIRDNRKLRVAKLSSRSNINFYRSQAILLAIERCKRVFQISQKVLFAFQPNRQAEQRIANTRCMPRRRVHACMGHGRRMRDQAFHTAEGLGKREQRKLRDEATNHFDVAAELEAQHGADSDCWDFAMTCPGCVSSPG